MRSRHRILMMAAGVVTVVVLGVAAWIGWPWIQFSGRFEALGLNAQGFPEYRHRQTGIVMVRLPGGTFWMGAQSADPEARNFDARWREWPEIEELWGPVHKVEIGPFLLAKYEVTQRSWARVMGFNRSSTRGADLPVENVSWIHCQEFCRKVGLRLPTEAQWEYAARGGGEGPFAGAERIDGVAWYDGNAGDEAHPVGKKQANGFGLHDMCGNVSEWCEDVHPYPGSSLDPSSLSMHKSVTGEMQVSRDGSYGLDEDQCCLFVREFRPAEDTLWGLGFRLAYWPLP